MPAQTYPPALGSERLQRALDDGLSARPDLNALRDGVTEYVAALLQSGYGISATVIAVKEVVSRFNGRHGTHFAELAAQVVTWSIDEYYRAQEKFSSHDPATDATDRGALGDVPSVARTPRAHQGAP